MSGKDYCDPKQNPLILTDVEGVLDDKANEAAKAPPFDFDEGRAPFKPPAAITAQGLTARIAAVYPGVDAFALGRHQLVRMADGSFSLDSKPLAEAPLETLAEIAELVKDG